MIWCEYVIPAAFWYHATDTTVDDWHGALCWHFHIHMYCMIYVTLSLQFIGCITRFRSVYPYSGSKVPFIDPVSSTKSWQPAMILYLQGPQGQLGHVPDATHSTGLHWNWIKIHLMASSCFCSHVLQCGVGRIQLHISMTLHEDQIGTW